MGRPAQQVDTELKSVGVHVPGEYLGAIAEKLAPGESVEYGLRVQADPLAFAVLTDRRLLSCTCRRATYSMPVFPEADLDPVAAGQALRTAPVEICPASCSIGGVELADIKEVGWSRARPFSATSDTTSLEVFAPYRFAITMDTTATTARQRQDLLAQIRVQAERAKVRPRDGSPLVAELERLAQLKERGAITAREFNAAKRKLLQAS